MYALPKARMGQPRRVPMELRNARTLTGDGLGRWLVPEGGECLRATRMGKVMREGEEGGERKRILWQCESAGVRMPSRAVCEEETA